MKDGKICGVSEVERRRHMLDDFKKKYGKERFVLLGLIEKCLNGLQPKLRPVAEDVRKMVEKELQEIWNPNDQWECMKHWKVHVQSTLCP